MQEEPDMGVENHLKILRTGSAAITEIQDWFVDSPFARLP